MIRKNNFPESMSGVAHWIIFYKENLVVPKTNSSSLVPIITKANEKPKLPIITEEYLGEEEGIHIIAGDTKDEPNQDEYQLINLRQEYKNISSEKFTLYGYAAEVIHWSRSFNFCGVCGAKTERDERDRAKRCPNCGNISYPRISPAIIVAIRRENKILLAHNKHFRENHYSTIAGFIEPGETAEDAVEREVYEEVGVKIKNIRYVASQAWPFQLPMHCRLGSGWCCRRLAPDRLLPVLQRPRCLPPYRHSCLA